MKDRFRREISYLRISLTDRCNYRCLYCMPEYGVEKRSHSDILTFEEIEEIVRESAELGIRKLRLTGGEPLVRKGITDLCRSLSSIPGINDLSLTTNGALLPNFADDLRRAGLLRVNISIDSLDPENFRRISRTGSLNDTLEGIRAAKEAGLTPIKLNVVLIGGINDHEIEHFVELTRFEPYEVRFIELMPIGDTEVFAPDAFISCSEVLQRRPDLEPIEDDGNGVAALYRLPGAKGRVGLIRPLSCSFCSRCSRLRLTADGFIKPCLHSEKELPVRGLHGESLRDRIVDAILEKPLNHAELSSQKRSHSLRNMNEIGG